MTTTALSSNVKVADEVWIATALLHREHPERADFSIEEILERARSEALVGELRPGVYVHIVQHCVANRPPNPGRYRMLYETAPSRRRLFRPSDSQHPRRAGGKMTPRADQMPHGYSGLLDWYRGWCLATGRTALKEDALLALAGTGKKLWADEHADEYVRRLREGWE